MPKLLNNVTKMFHVFHIKSLYLSSIPRLKSRFPVFSLTYFILSLTIAVILLSQRRLATNHSHAAIQCSTHELPSTLKEEQFIRGLKYSSKRLAVDLQLLKDELFVTQSTLVNSSFHFHRIGKHIEVLHGIMQSIQYSGNKAINLDIRSQVGNIIPPKREVLSG